jgi:hypothetical protein
MPGVEAPTKRFRLRLNFHNFAQRSLAIHVTKLGLGNERNKCGSTDPSPTTLATNQTPRQNEISLRKKSADGSIGDKASRTHDLANAMVTSLFSLHQIHRVDLITGFTLRRVSHLALSQNAQFSGPFSLFGQVLNLGLYFRCSALYRHADSSFPGPSLVT